MKKLVFLVIFLYSFFHLQAQTRTGRNQFLQFYGGANVYSGEIGGANTGVFFLDEWNFPNTRWHAGVGYKVAIDNRFNVRLLAQYMRLAGNSQNLKNSSEFSYIRSFESRLFEAGANLEFSFWNLLKHKDIMGQMYVFAGTGMMFGTRVDFKSVPPIRESKTNTVDFAPQPSPYLMGGVGFQRNYSRVAVGVELWGQMLMSHFEDGIRYSNSNFYDFSAGITLIVSLRTGKQEFCFCDF
ncbi:MAG: hypothetical protein LBS01_11020 [Prevotellaceae bacterium]|jgi:hypothetical protein|nr:hypothetical protein [Prevotellaceae bacterium]